MGVIQVMASSPPEKKPKSERSNPATSRPHIIAFRPFFAGSRGLKERLDAGETILCAEGYLLAFVRSGYVLQGLWVPEFVLDYPDVLRQQHYEFVRAGSDVTEAYQVRFPRGPTGVISYSYPLAVAKLLIAPFPAFSITVPH